MRWRGASAGVYTQSYTLSATRHDMRRCAMIARGACFATSLLAAATLIVYTSPPDYAAPPYARCR